MKIEDVRIKINTSRLSAKDSVGHSVFRDTYNKNLKKINQQ